MLRDAFPAIVEALTQRVPVSLSRWGDGEWHAILGHRGQNCDGQVYTAPLRDALTGVLVDRPTYQLGLQPFALTRLGTAIRAWLDARHLAPDWVNGDLFAEHSQSGTLAPFLAAVSERTVVFVGPPHLDELSLFPVARSVRIPARSAFAVWRDILRNVQQAIQATSADVVLLSAGMSSNLIVHALSTSHPGVSALDCGSLWEPYVGKVTRTYHAAIVARAQAHA